MKEKQPDMALTDALMDESAKVQQTDGLHPHHAADGQEKEIDKIIGLDCGAMITW